MANPDYTVPVKIRLEKGRYRHGYLKKLSCNKGEKVSIMYAGGLISSCSAASIIHVPEGFNLRTS